MRKFLQRLLRRPVWYLANRMATNPDTKKVHTALSHLHQEITTEPGKRGEIISFGQNHKFIIFSDQHKGAKDGSDDFAFAEKNYLTALDFYAENGYYFINLGDCEELWENRIEAVKKNNLLSFEKEKQFLENNAYTKIFGNHDLYWDNDPLSSFNLESIYGRKVKIYEGLILQTSIAGQVLSIFLTHGHQGDSQSDGNWFSKWFVAKIWGPLQMFLELNLNTPSTNNHIKTVHNRIMYEWSAGQKQLLLITGHTHQPVFESLTHLERLYQKLDFAKENKDTAEIKDLEGQINARQQKGESIPDFTAYQPCYFNSGCCCFDDGGITGIEISDGKIRLIKWDYKENGQSERSVLEEALLENLLKATESRLS